MSRIWASILIGLVLTGCASPYRIVQIPQREADMYPLSQTKAGLTIAIDEIRGAARAQRYFGADLIKAGIMPVIVVVSNYGEHRVVVKPSDVLLQRGRDIVDPLPIQTVIATAQDQRWFLRKRTRQSVDNFFYSVVFKEAVLLPNDTYQGVMFFSNPKPKRNADRFFTVWSLFAEGGPRVRVGVTDLDEQDRMHFGPFTLSSSEDTLRSAWPQSFERF
jgi:hypothetical protein